MRKCIVEGCEISQKLNCFPVKNKKLFKLWCLNIGRPDLLLPGAYKSNNHRICCQHFEEKYLNQYEVRQQKIIYDGYPTINVPAQKIYHPHDFDQGNIFIITFFLIF